MYRKGNSMYIRWRYRILFLAWELTLIMSVMVPVDRDTTKTEMYIIMGRTFGVIYPILGIAVPILIVLVVSRKNIMEKNLLQENYIAAELEYISQYKKSQEETRAFRHDVINNLSLLSSMIKNDKNKEADAYLEEMLGEDMHTMEDIEKGARKLQSMGAQNVLVSMAEKGALLIDDTGAVHICPACKGKAVNSVGAGDSMVAGFIAGVLLQQEWDDANPADYSFALKLGTAAGGATAFSDGLAKKALIDKLLKELG
jgi:hypothetical protein